MKREKKIYLPKINPILEEKKEVLLQDKIIFLDKKYGKLAAIFISIILFLVLVEKLF